MRKLILYFIICILVCVCLNSYVVQNPKLEECYIQTETIISIKEGSAFDIVFSDIHGDHYYINRGLEMGLNLDSLNAKVLNKTVTLHLPNLLGGLVISEHIAQLEVGEEIIFTEFN